ncbi:MAG: 5-oxoprolinase [Candidatus Nitronauta litoralis]|uniref:5-oxoprolinase n=1 Tax=Candidatus Nitronauta litoralis TaxID=2705533 RepID=A0A7T0G1B6_9BACT|nr:MAG: 5-oxoprolinase [Candidatus Nitronauta litoralis]
MKPAPGFWFSIDRGGTFTDVYAEVPGQPGFRLVKLLSKNPKHYADPAIEAIRRIITDVTRKPWHPETSAGEIDSVRMGTTLATNALLEKKGTRTALVITRGFGDLLEIGKQNRPHLFELKIKKPDNLYEAVVEVDERVRLPINGKKTSEVEIIKSPDLDRLREDFTVLKKKGVVSLAVVCLHAWWFPDHERMIGDLARKVGFEFVYLSHEVMPRIKFVDRGQTCLVEAYLTPTIRSYCESFSEAFHQVEPELLFMQSDGGLVPPQRYTGSNAILSGPAGGVVGYSQSVWKEEDKVPVIGFDMGGTSTDVSRFDGEYDLIQESMVAGIHLQTPQLDIHTIAAGGGSLLTFQNGMLAVGPESSGAYPGPVCYRNGGQLSITDANLFLGRLHPDFFPKIFGRGQDESLDQQETRRAMTTLTEEINHYVQENGGSTMSPEQVAEGFIEVANEQMARAIREVTETRGFDVRDHILACFGGAGGQHACALARALGIRKVVIHRFAGILSAYGLALADVVRDLQEPVAFELADSALPEIRERFQKLETKAKGQLNSDGFVGGAIQIQRYLQLAYKGTDFGVMVIEEEDKPFADSFRELIQRQFGFLPEEKTIWVEALRVRAIGKKNRPEIPDLQTVNSTPVPESTTSCFFETDWFETSIYRCENLGAGHVIDGPALLIQNTSTIVVPPDCRAELTLQGDVLIDITLIGKKQTGEEYDPVRLAVFGNRFMSIAEQMGHVLKRTALSTNIKERQDFSCALFSPEGDLIANAPHQPVHLGSMGEAVKAQIRLQGQDCQEGDVWISNHPVTGGTHLPDITVITPVIEKGRPVFFVASRGHHADIGGIAPGSMPASATRLVEEGAAIKSFKLVDRGNFQTEGITRLLTESNSRDIDGNSIPGSRALADNLSDLKAQIAANRRGCELLNELIESQSLKTVHAYMQYIRNSAAQAVTECIAKLSGGSKKILTAGDHMDDDTELCLQLELNPNGKALFDFSGTGSEVKGNLNAPRAVTYSAVLYCLRCLVGGEIPLNQGCLDPIDFEIPPGSILFPSENAAVAAGNVLTSQRVVDLVFKALGTVAASQGCMNNLTFGNDRFAYYETIGGGAGAGPDFSGASGVHTHMTNTRITDPEVLELRYPVLLREFSIRRNSGGKGKFSGGDGLIREIEFLEKMHVAILSERRVYAPYGLHGAASGETGKNYLIRKDGVQQNLGSKVEFEVQPNERVRILTPGGGGFGPGDG